MRRILGSIALCLMLTATASAAVRETVTPVVRATTGVSPRPAVSTSRSTVAARLIRTFAPTAAQAVAASRRTSVTALRSTVPTAAAARAAAARFARADVALELSRGWEGSWSQAGDTSTAAALAEARDQAEINAVAGFALVIGALSEGNMSAAQQAAVIGRDAAAAALIANSDEAAAMAQIFTALSEFMATQSLVWGGGPLGDVEFTSDAVYITGSDGRVFEGTYGAFGTVMDRTLQRTGPIFEEGSFPTDPWETNGPGEGGGNAEACVYYWQDAEGDFVTSGRNNRALLELTQSYMN